LVAYLALPQASETLANRLRCEIRNKFPDVASVKMYNMGLHMHSTKTCCAPCEYSLLGLMNYRGVARLKKSRRMIGFYKNFEQACENFKDYFNYKFPQDSNFQMIVTVTASETDAHHQSKPRFTITDLGDQETFNPYEISVKSQRASEKIFITLLNSKFDRRRFPTESNLSDLTVGISGSNATPGSNGTMNKVNESRIEEVDNLSDRLSVLKL